MESVEVALDVVPGDPQVELTDDAQFGVLIAEGGSELDAFGLLNYLVSGFTVINPGDLVGVGRVVLAVGVHGFQSRVSDLIGRLIILHVQDQVAHLGVNFVELQHAQVGEYLTISGAPVECAAGCCLHVVIVENS